MLRNIEKKDFFGIGLVILSLILFFMIILSPTMKLLFNIDEFFTLGVIKAPLLQSVTITANDVHPPLYYIILKTFIKIFAILNINVDTIYLSKIITALPYLVIIMLSSTKIRKEYGWMTAGLFAISLFAFSEFFEYYITMRMYSWSVLFLVLSFVYAKDVLIKSDLKSWFLLSLFTVLGAYTHYFNIVSSIALFLLLLIYILFNKDDLYDRKSEFKKWIVSMIAITLSYLPWLFVIINQLGAHENYWIPQIDMSYLLECICYFSVHTSDGVFQIISIFLLMFFSAIAMHKFKDKMDLDNYYILMAISIFILTILIGLVISFTVKPIIRYRYLMASVGVLWLGISILVGKMENKYLQIASILVILLLAISGASGLIHTHDKYCTLGSDNKEFFDGINNNDTVILTKIESKSLSFKPILDNTSFYSSKDSLFGLSNKEQKEIFDIEYSPDLKDTIEKNKDKNIYYIQSNNKTSDLVKDNEPAHKIGRITYFYKIN